MPLSAGTRLGPYEVLHPIGAGGMGEVYRARDERLGRDVAIKILPQGFAADPEMLRRFEQEARAAGGLNHPGILAIHDAGAHDGHPYLVSELLQGSTLRETISGAALPQRKAIDYAIQTARALAAAHEKGIVHRDLKPENLFVTNDGRVKILDFGIARVVRPGIADGARTAAPTAPVATAPGTILGTLGYISPEQLKDRPADHRSDIFALGAILYEMLTGRRAFAGASSAEAISAVLREEPPDLATAGVAAPPALERIVFHCLEKNPDERFQSARDLAFNLETLSGPREMGATAGPQEGGAPAPQARGRGRLGWALALIASLAAIGLSTQLARRAPALERQVRASIDPPAAAGFGDVFTMALSPDGSRVVYVGPAGDGNGRIWVRRIDETEAKPIAGTESGGQPFWSPDGRSLGFIAQGKVKRVDVAGGPVLTLCDDPALGGGSWSRKGAILFVSGGQEIREVPATGGASKALTHIDLSRGDWAHARPQFLPDGDHFIYLARTSKKDTRGIYVGSLAGAPPVQVLSTDVSAAYADPGWLLFVREGTLMAQKFDATSFALSGQPRAVAESVGYNMNSGRADFTVSNTGLLAYQTGEIQTTDLVWFDREGHRLGLLGTSSQTVEIALSPDEKKVAMERTDPKTRTGDIWIADIAHGSASKLTFDPGWDWTPVWSPDGARIAFASNRDDLSDLYVKAASGAGDEQVLLAAPGRQNPDDWSPDGRDILYESSDPNTGRDLWVLPVDGDRTPAPLIQTPFEETLGQFSPDGRFVAYASNDSGTTEVYVQTFPVTGSKWQISTHGGTNPKWRRDGKEIYYIAADRMLMAADVTTGPSFEAGVPKPLFETRPPWAWNDRSSYAVSTDGKRFLVIMLKDGERPPPVTLVVNWSSGLR